MGINIPQSMYSTPMAHGEYPDYNSQLQASLAIADTIEQKKKRQALRDVFSSGDAFSDEGLISPTTLGKVAQIDPALAQSYQSNNVAAQYKRAMANSANSRAGFWDARTDAYPEESNANVENKLSGVSKNNAQTEAIKTKTQDQQIQEIFKPQAAAFVPLQHKTAENITADDYNGIKAAYAPHVVTDEIAGVLPTDPPEVRVQKIHKAISSNPQQNWIPADDYQKEFGGEFDPATTPQELAMHKDLTISGAMGLKAYTETKAKWDALQTQVKQKDEDQAFAEKKLAQEKELAKSKIAVAKEKMANLNINQLNSDQQDAITTAIVEGRLDPIKVNSRNQQIYANAEMANPGTNFNEISAQLGYDRSPQVSNKKAILSSVNPELDNLLNLGNKLSNTSFPLANAAINLGKEVTGNPDIVAFNNARDDAIANVERGLLGTGALSDSKYLRAVSNVKSAQSPTQLKAAVDQMRFAIKTALGATEKGPYPGAAQPPKIPRRTLNPSTKEPTTEGKPSLDSFWK